MQTYDWTPELLGEEAGLPIVSMPRQIRQSEVPWIIRTLMDHGYRPLFFGGGTQYHYRDRPAVICERRAKAKVEVQ